MPISKCLRIESRNFTILIAGLRLKRLTEETVGIVLERLSKSKIPVLLLDARGIWSIRHILIATHMALRSWIRKENIARKLPLEIMLYASATREIDRAVKLLGLKPGLTEIVACIIVEGMGSTEELMRELMELLDEELIIEVDDSLLEPGPLKEKLISWFSLTEEELKATYARDRNEAIEKCIIARMAYLNISKL